MNECVPVIFSGVGVENYDDNDERCIKLKEILNADCVKAILTRDDIDTLKNKYIYNKNINIARVCDPALWSPDVIKISKDEESDCYGLGVVREKIYEANGLDFDLNRQLTFWEQVIDTLNAKGLKWKLFTNGLLSDYEFALKLLEHLGLSGEEEKYLCKRPETSEELVNQIAKFKAIAAFRLHSNIIAYALDVPAVGMIWNRKVKMFGDIIGYPERYFELHGINGEDVVEAMLNAEKQGYNEHKRKTYRTTVYKELKKNIKHCLKDLDRCDKVDYSSKKIVVAGVGGKCNARIVNQKFYEDIAYFVDLKHENWGTTFKDKPVYSPMHLFAEDKKDIFIVIARNPNYYDMAKYLERYGYSMWSDFAGAYKLKNYKNVGQYYFVETDWDLN